MHLKVIFADLAAEQDVSRPPLPTLGEILDRLEEERPGLVLECDPAWRKRLVAQVEVVTGR